MLNNKIIKTRYVSTANLNYDPAEDANKLIQYAQGYAIKLLQETRTKVAKQILNTRKRCERISYKIGSKRASLELANLIKTQMSSFDEYMKNLKEDCFNISLKLIKSILQTEMRKSSTSLYQRLNKALSSISDKNNLKILVNPLDYPKLLKIDPSLENSLVKSEEIKIGNATITTPIGNTEINWQEHLQLLSAIIQNKINNN